MKRTSPKAVHSDGYIFNQMLRRKDQRVTSVVDIVCACNRPRSVNYHVLEPDYGLVAAPDTL